MAELTVDKTYGGALYQAAKENGTLEQVSKDAEELSALIKAETELASFLYAPTISAKEKKIVLKDVFQGKICDELLNLMYVLCDKGRCRHITKILKSFKEELNRQEGYAYGTIVSVIPLNKEQLEKFELETGKLINQKVRLENEIDSSLIGGVTVYVDGRIIDMSILGRIKSLELAIN